MRAQSERIHAQAAAYLVRSSGESAAERAVREAWLAADPRHRAAYQQLLDVDAHASAVLDDAELQAATARDLELLTPPSKQRRRWPWVLLAAMSIAAIGYAVRHALMR
ncbi:ferric-dicitrate binding protein FerR (iron transport regulator) [Xanthomonas arboricola]